VVKTNVKAWQIGERSFLSYPKMYLLFLQSVLNYDDIDLRSSSMT
jgi:hypothetical protein